MKIYCVIILLLFIHISAKVCEQCQESLKNCLNDQTHPVEFLTGKKNAKTCECCKKYDECVGENECEFTPSICYKTDCRNLELMGWIAICVIIVILLLVIAVIYLYYRIRFGKKTEKKDIKNLTPNPVEKEMKNSVANANKHKDVEINYQKLSEVLESSSSSSSSSDEDNVPVKELTKVQIAK